MKNNALTVINGAVIRQDENSLVNLTDILKSSGETNQNQDHGQWSRKEWASFIHFVDDNLNVPEKHIYKAAEKVASLLNLRWTS